MNTNEIKGSLKRQSMSSNGIKDNTTQERPSKYPIFLSAAVYPGIGQIFQRRIIVGIFFIATFSIAFIAFLFLMGGIIVDFYSLGFNFDNAKVNANPPLIPALSAFGVALMIYIISLIDTHAAYRRQLVADKRNMDIMDGMDEV